MSLMPNAVPVLVHMTTDVDSFCETGNRETYERDGIHRHVKRGGLLVRKYFIKSGGVQSYSTYIHITFSDILEVVLRQMVDI